MKINEDCIRDILRYYVENLEVFFGTHNRCGFSEITLLATIEKFKDEYTKADIWYSVYNLSQDRFIETNDIYRISRDSGLAYVIIYNVTHKGHQFYESIQPEPIWNKTKKVVSKIGVHTLDFIECVAHDIAIESAKQAVTLVMTQK